MSMWDDIENDAKAQIGEARTRVFREFVAFVAAEEMKSISDVADKPVVLADGILMLTSIGVMRTQEMYPDSPTGISPWPHLVATAYLPVDDHVRCLPVVMELHPERLMVLAGTLAQELNRPDVQAAIALLPPIDEDCDDDC